MPVLPEEFTRTLRQTLPALMPPLMAVFILLSMPVVLLLLKGIGDVLLTQTGIARKMYKDTMGRGDILQREGSPTMLPSSPLLRESGWVRLA